MILDFTNPGNSCVQIKDFRQIEQNTTHGPAEFRRHNNIAQKNQDTYLTGGEH